MGTRGAIGFRVNGIDKITYNHFDSYPSGVGETIVSNVKAFDDDAIRKTAEAVVLVNEMVPPTAAQVEACSRFVNLGVSERSVADWYCLTRNAQGDLSPYLRGELPYIIDSHGFMGDSLFCEYAYILNVDEGVVEFYKGFNKNPDAEGRYASLVDGEYNREVGYCGVRLVATRTFDQVRNLTPETKAALWERIENDEGGPQTANISVTRTITVAVGESIEADDRPSLPVGTRVANTTGGQGTITDTGTQWDDDCPHPRFVPHDQSKYPVTIVSFP